MSGNEYIFGRSLLNLEHSDEQFSEENLQQEIYDFNGDVSHDGDYEDDVNPEVLDQTNNPDFNLGHYDDGDDDVDDINPEIFDQTTNPDFQLGHYNNVDPEIFNQTNNPGFDLDHYDVGDTEIFDQTNNPDFDLDHYDNVDPEIVDDMSESFDEILPSHVDESVMWQKVVALKRQLSEEQNDVGYRPRTNWNSMTREEKQKNALSAVEDTILDQMTAMVEVK